MTPRTRKLLGAIMLIVFLTIYSLLAAAAAVVLQVNAGPWLELVYYIVAGLLWVLPAGLIIKWMSKPPKSA